MLATGVFRRLAPKTKEVVKATFYRGVGVVETALGPSVVSSAVSRPKNTTKMMTMMTLDQTRGMFDLSSQVFPKHPVHGDNAPNDLDRSEAV